MAMLQRSCRPMLSLCEVLEYIFTMCGIQVDTFVMWVVIIKGFLFDPGGHVFNVMKRSKMPFDPGGRA